jgi:AraC-like DNA-binding protein
MCEARSDQTICLARPGHCVPTPRLAAVTTATLPRNNNMASSKPNVKDSKIAALSFSAASSMPAFEQHEFARVVTFDRETFVMLRQLHLAAEGGEPVLRLQTLLTVGLSQLFRRHAGALPSRELPRPSRRKIALVREYLDTHFAAKVSLDDLSRLAGLSAYHLVRSFLDEVGLPPCQYQIHRRVLYALGRLRQGAAISQAAYEAGFVDQSHLNRHFKRILGVTPGLFRVDRKNVQDRRHR